MHTVKQTQLKWNIIGLNCNSEHTPALMNWVIASFFSHSFRSFFTVKLVEHFYTMISPIWTMDLSTVPRQLRASTLFITLRASNIFCQSNFRRTLPRPSRKWSRWKRRASTVATRPPQMKTKPKQENPLRQKSRRPKRYVLLVIKNSISPKRYSLRLISIECWL